MVNGLLPGQRRFLQPKKRGPSSVDARRQGQESLERAALLKEKREADAEARKQRTQDAEQRRQEIVRTALRSPPPRGFIRTAQGKIITPKESLKRDIESKLARAGDIRRFRETVQDKSDSELRDIQTKVIQEQQQAQFTQQPLTFREREEAKAMEVKSSRQAERELSMKPIIIKENGQEFEIVGTIQPAERQTGIEGFSQLISGRRGTLRQKKLRGDITSVEELELVGLTGGQTFVDAIIGVKNIPALVKKVIKDPKIVKELPSLIEESGRNFGETLRVSPTEALVQVGGEILIFKGTSAAINKFSKLAKNVVPKNINKLKRGKNVSLSTTTGERFTVKIVNKVAKPVVNQIRRNQKNIITLKDIQQNARLTQIDNFSKRLADFFIKRNKLKLGTFDRADLQRAIAQRLREAFFKQRKITLSKVKSTINKKSFIDKVLETLKKPKKKKLKFRRKPLIKLRELKATARSDKIKRLSRRLVDGFIKRNKLDVDVSQKIDLIKGIENRIEIALKGKKVTLEAVSNQLKKKSFVQKVLAKIRLKPKKRLRKGQEITLREIEADILSKRINKASKKLADKVIKKGKRKPSIFDRIDLEKRIGEALRKELIKKKKVTKKTISKITKKKGFFKKILEKVKRKPVKKLRKGQEISLREIEADLEAVRIKKFSKKLSNTLIKKSKKPFSIFDRIDLEKAIGERIRKSLRGEKVTRNKIIRVVQKEKIVKKVVAEPKFTILTTKAKKLKVIKERVTPLSKLKGKFEKEIRVGKTIQIQKIKQVTKTKKISATKKVQIKVQSKIIKLRSQRQEKLFSKINVIRKQRAKMRSQAILLQRQGKKKALGLALLSLAKSKKALAQTLKFALANASKTKKAQRNLTSIISDIATVQATATAKILKKVKKKIDVPVKVKIGVPITIPKPTPSKKKKKIIKRLKKKQGYNAFAKSRGKFKKLNLVPLTRNQARDLASFGIDRGLERTGSIRRTPSKIRKPLTRIPRGHFNKNINKFRTFRKVKGVKIPLKNKIIERRKFALDTKSEKKRITALAIIGKRRKKIKKQLIKLRRNK